MDWKNNKIVGIAAALVVVLAVIVVIISLQPKKQSVCLMSEETSDVMVLKIPYGAEYPVNNPKTGIKDLYPAQKVKCEKCGWEGFVISFKKPGEPADAKCPECGAESRNLRMVE